MPLLTHPVGEPDTTTAHYLSPLSFMTILIITTTLFLLALGLMAAYEHNLIPADLHIAKRDLLIAISFIPPVVILVVMLIAPVISSPLRPYLRAVADRPQDLRLRWNLAVIATAHVFSGTVAQAEWLSQMVWLADADRLRAFQYIKRVRERLQAVPALHSGDVIATIIAGIATTALSQFVFRFQILESVLNSLALMVVLQLLMLYFFLQRWQHVRRLLELEEVFDELLPSERPSLATQVQAPEDDFSRWQREAEEGNPAVAAVAAPTPEVPEEHSAFLRLWK